MSVDAEVVKVDVDVSDVDVEIGKVDVDVVNADVDENVDVLGEVTAKGFIAPASTVAGWSIDAETSAAF